MTFEPDDRTATALLERIIDAPCNLIIVETSQAPELVAEMRLLARHSGQALYLWSEEEGLYSLRDGSIQVDEGASLSDTLRFIRRSMHFGVYLLRLEHDQLSPQHVAALAEIARLQDGPARRVVLLMRDGTVAPRLGALSLHLRLAGGEATRPRLRDGRWVH